ncbi:PAS domain-containing sensor histidine kinase [Pararhodobacter oceanensis]|uniref:histidine kinase n=1 Tax=Pararhodobacter oceanensis TaxID=2172121 RepID=A0A2T8HRK7_9RHOB|nr:PAS domain-containing sensor histidine kinase [Pararhodobacter oceanensis]PVH28023.1 hybrid sensor histidine kinase/response regulator [Pararhodobacter oceanensis]
MQIDLDALFAKAPSPYMLVDTDLRIVWANAAYLAVTGRTQARLIGRILTEEFPAPPESLPDQMLRGSFKQVLETGEADHLPLIAYPIHGPDGQLEERYWSATHTPVLNADGAVAYILQNTVDVTDLHRGAHGGGDGAGDGGAPLNLGVDTTGRSAALLQRAEAVANENLALGQMMDFFQSAFDQAPSFMAIVNGPEHVFQVVNQAYSDLTGHRDILGKSVSEALPEIAGQGFLNLLDQVYTSGEPVSFTEMPAQIQSDPNAPPSLHFIDFIYHPLSDRTGKTVGIFVQGHDVTGKKIAEKQLTATREKFRTMAQTMPNQVWTADKDGALTWLNQRTYEFTGYSEGELYGADWAKVVHPDDLATTVENWAGAIVEGKTYEAEFRIRKADGSYRWHIVRASPLHADDGTLSGWVGTNTDIEDRKNTEAEIAKLNATLEARVAKRNRELEAVHAALRQSQKLEAIGSLAGGIAHDFNNLLQVVTGNLQIAMRGMAAESEARARLEQAMRSVKRGATLASQLLSFARKQPLAPVVINLSQLISETSEIVHSAIGEGVELEIDLAEGLWNTNIDPNSMENALLNLAINARDAMEGQGRLTVTACNIEIKPEASPPHPDVGAGEYVRISVADSGSGMTPETLERVFEPFFTTKSDGHGTGLGLSMVYGFAKQSGGYISLDSEVGAGTTFHLYLPRSHEAVQELPGMADAGLAGGSERILLVEDDEDVRDTARHSLQQLGYQVTEAGDAEAALRLLAGGERVDLLFTDVVMPGKMSGYDLALKLQELHPEVPVLFTSGFVQDQIMHDGRLDEGVELLGKPYSQTELARRLREMLGSAGVAVEISQQEQPEAAEFAPRAVEAARGGQLRVLVVEDDALIRLDLVQMLREAEFEVIEAGTVAKALELLTSAPVDLLITDVGLPDRTGEELAKEARGLQADLPVIFATGGMDVPSAASLGNCEVLSKPFGDIALMESIEAAMCRDRKTA